MGATSAITSGGTEVYSQMKSGEDINWGQVGVKAVSGFVEGCFLGEVGNSMAKGGKEILKNTAKVMGVNGGVGFASGALYEAMDVIEEDGVAGLADADNVKQILKSGATEGATSAVFSGATYMAGQAVKNLCFTEGTLVSTAEGLVAIECITAGMLVYAYSEETGRTELKEVVQTFENETSELVHITVNGEEIEATPSHPFYSPVKGWTEAVDLRAGDILVLRGDEYVIVEQVQHEILENPVKVYNFEVEDYHTYFVGESEVLVHNMCAKAASGADSKGKLVSGGANDTEIPWSSGVVSDASKQLDDGAKSVTVNNRSQAEELFLGKYQGEGYTNVTGMDAMDAKNLLGGKGNTYHWDDTFGADGYLLGHGAGNPDATMPHLQIHPDTGKVIRIFFENSGGN